MKRLTVLSFLVMMCAGVQAVDRVDILFTGQVDSAVGWDLRHVDANGVIVPYPMTPRYSVGQTINYSLSFDPGALEFVSPGLYNVASGAGTVTLERESCTTGPFQFRCNAYGGLASIMVALTPMGTLDLARTQAALQSGPKPSIDIEIGGNGFSYHWGGLISSETFSGHTLTTTIFDPTGRFTIPAVPEPPSSYLLVLGLGALLATRGIQTRSTALRA